MRALDEHRSHRRRVGLQLGKFTGIFGRQRFGNGREQLRHLHDRPLEAAEGAGQFRGILGLVSLETEPGAGWQPAAAIEPTLPPTRK